MAVACPTSFDPSIALDAPFAEGLDRPTFTSDVAPARSPSQLAARLRDAPTAPGAGGDVAWDFADSQPPPSVQREPEWCVDLGEEMIALHTVELYARLATRALSGDVRVWRCGREAWTPAREVPELRYAIDDDGPDAAPEVEVRGDADLDAELLAALEFAHAG
jgi:hypothetical protein